MIRTWTPSHDDILDGVPLFIYDFGDYVGELCGDEWSCWRIIKREALPPQSIVEQLQLMPPDWVPLEALSVQEYLFSPSENRLTGWKRTEQLQTSLIQEQPQIHQRPLQQQQQQQQQKNQINQGPSRQRQQPQQQRQRPKGQRGQQKPQHLHPPGQHNRVDTKTWTGPSMTSTPYQSQHQPPSSAASQPQQRLPRQGQAASDLNSLVPSQVTPTQQPFSQPPTDFSERQPSRQPRGQHGSYHRHQSSRPSSHQQMRHTPPLVTPQTAAHSSASTNK